MACAMRATTGIDRRIIQASSSRTEFRMLGTATMSLDDNASIFRRLQRLIGNQRNYRSIFAWPYAPVIYEINSPKNSVHGRRPASDLSGPPAVEEPIRWTGQWSYLGQVVIFETEEWEHQACLRLEPEHLEPESDTNDKIGRRCAFSKQTSIVRTSSQLPLLLDA